MNLNYEAALNNRTGYSIASVALGLELSKIGHSLCLFPIGGISKEKNIEEWAYKNHYKNKECDYCAVGLKCWHQFDLFQFPICSERVGFPIFELDTFTKQELNSLGSVDRLVVTSDWAKEVCVSNNVLTEEKINVCPLGVDTSIFKPRVKPQSDKYVFANVGKFEKRKQFILADIFNKAFEQTDDVELWILGHNPFLNEQQTKDWIKTFKDSKLGNKIKLFSPLPTLKDVAEFISRADCGLFPFHAEGWLLEGLEFMACNIPLILTNYSAPTQYCNEGNSFLVNVTEKEIAKDGVFFNEQGSWAKLGNSQIDQFVDHMRFVYEHRISENHQGLETARNFTWKNSAQTLSKILFA